MKDLVTERMDLKELIERQIAFFHEAYWIHEGYSQENNHLMDEAEEIFASTQNPDPGTEEGRQLYRKLSRLRTHQYRVLEAMRFYNTLNRYIDCYAMLNGFKKVYEELWPDEKDEHAVEFWVKEIKARRKELEEARRSDKEAGPADSVS